ncbi:MAG TPA: hypothetical protein PJ990_18575, partial [Saprospiraceae bacterium]|nr:hypothetical protein [Saprospiraceae bacterium]
MKKLILILSLIYWATLIFSQRSLQGFNYQGVARDQQGNALTNTHISIQIQLKDESQVVFKEIHETTTTDLGVFSIVIGQGLENVLNSTLEDIPWGQSDLSLNVAIDPTGGREFLDAGTSILWSVPYAMFASSGV